MSDTPESFSAVHPAAQTLPLVLAPTTRGRERNTIREPIQAIACWRLNDARFDLGLSFLRPEAKREIETLRNLLAHHPGSKLTIFGHADPTGSDDDNKLLAGRRAVAMFGLLTRDVASWERLYDQPVGPDRWGTAVLQRILDALGFPPGPIDGIEGKKTQDALLAFQRSRSIATTGESDKATRAQLFAAYMDFLCAVRLTKSDFLGGGTDPQGKADFQGCGEFNATVRPSRAQESLFQQAAHRQERDDFHAPNRRILILLFRATAPSPPAKWPCPRASEGAADCRKRFWSDHEQRRAAGSETRSFDKSQDTFACRFYQRLVEESPCEFPSRPRRLRVILRDEQGRLLPNHPFTLEIDGLLVEPEGVTNAEALVDCLIPAGAASGKLTIDRHIWNLLLEDPPPHSMEEGVRVRLANLGFHPDKEFPEQARLDFALWDLQHFAGIDKSGKIDGATVSFLDKEHKLG
jgi:hypothetical protein